jgi:hypothetical protein
MNRDLALEKIRRDVAEADRKCLDPRYLVTMGKMIATGALQTNDKAVIPVNDRLNLEDALWAAELEPRILEVLPGLMINKPNEFYGLENTPEWFQTIFEKVQKGQTPDLVMLGIEPHKYLYWVDHLILK